MKQVLETVVDQPQASIELAGHPGLLADRLGSTEGLVRLAQEAAEAPIETQGTHSHWKKILSHYRDQILISLEWPTIVEAHEHTSRQRVRELIDLDRRLGMDARWQLQAEVSSRTGKTHLVRLRPLKDQRVVQRYIDAVEHGLAHAWHPVVYGAILSIYSMPLRQGLLHYSWIALCSRLLRLPRQKTVPLEQNVARLHAIYETLPVSLEHLLERSTTWPTTGKT